MKIRLLLITISLIILSCNNHREKELTERINSLENQNQKLKEEIESLIDLTFINTVMVPSFDKEEYKPNGKGKIVFQAHKFGDFLSPYELVDNLNTKKKGLVIAKNLKDSKFEYSFDLKQMKGNKVDLSMIFVVNDNIIVIPAKAEIKVRK
jgi:hypothetical protein